MTSQKQKKKGWILPEQLTGHDLVCVTLKVPQNDYYMGAFIGAIKKLGEWWNWEKSYDEGDTRATQAAQYWRTIIKTHLWIGECPPVTPPVYIQCLPIGAIVPFSDIQAPESGWLLCDGAVYQKTAYPDLYAKQLAAFQAGRSALYISADTFAVPNLTDQRVITGADESNIAGLYGGEKTVALTENQLPTRLTDSVAYTSFANATPGAGAYVLSGYIESAQGAQIFNTEGGEAHENMPPWMNFFYHILAVPCQAEVEIPEPPQPIWSGTSLSWDTDGDGIADTAPVDLQGEQGFPGECQDCGDEPPPPTIDYPDIPPDYPTPPPDIPCSAATRMANVLKDSLDDLIAEADNNVSFAVFLLKVIGLLFGSFFAGVGVDYISTLWDLVKDNVEFDTAFWDRVKCEAYCLLPESGLFDEAIVTELWHRLAEIGDAENDPRFNVVSGFIRVVQYNGINYLDHVEPDPTANCSGCNCGAVYELVDTFTVRASISAYQSGTHVTENGTMYRVEITGNVGAHVLHPDWLSDAQYDTTNNWGARVRDNNAQFDDGTRPAAIDTTYNPGHVYTFNRIGDGTTVGLRFYDTNYGDNPSSPRWTVRVYKRTS